MPWQCSLKCLQVLCVHHHCMCSCWHTLPAILINTTALKLGCRDQLLQNRVRVQWIIGWEGLATQGAFWLAFLHFSQAEVTAIMSCKRMMYGHLRLARRLRPRAPQAREACLRIFCHEDDANNTV